MQWKKVMQFRKGRWLFYIHNIFLSLIETNYVYFTLFFQTVCLSKGINSIDDKIKTITMSVPRITKKWLLTWPAVCQWRAYKSVWTCTFWFMINNLAVSSWCTWIAFSTWIDTFGIFTCVIKWTFVIVITSNWQHWLGWQSNYLKWSYLVKII